MKHALLAGAALVLTLSSAAIAQTTASTTSPAVSDQKITPGTPDGQPSTIPASTTTETTPATGQTPPVTPAPALTTAAASQFITIPATDDLSSRVVGLDVYNSSNQDIGVIKDIVLGKSGVKGYIIGVGGFLGLGDHYVGVSKSAITLSYSASDKKWHAAMDASADQLKAAPQYTYNSNS